MTDEVVEKVEIQPTLEREAVAKADAVSEEPIQRGPAIKNVGSKVNVTFTDAFILVQIDDGPWYGYSINQARRIADAIRQAANGLEKNINRQVKLATKFKVKSTKQISKSYIHHSNGKAS